MLFDLDKLFALLKGIQDLGEQWGEPLQESLATGVPQTNPDDRWAVFFQGCKGNEIGVFANNDRVFLPGPQPDRSIIGIVHSNVYNMFRSLALTLYPAGQRWRELCVYQKAHLGNMHHGVVEMLCGICKRCVYIGVFEI